MVKTFKKIFIRPKLGPTSPPSNYPDAAALYPASPAPLPKLPSVAEDLLVRLRDYRIVTEQKIASTIVQLEELHSRQQALREQHEALVKQIEYVEFQAVVGDGMKEIEAIVARLQAKANR